MISSPGCTSDVLNIFSLNHRLADHRHRDHRTCNTLSVTSVCPPMMSIPKAARGLHEFVHQLPDLCLSCRRRDEQRHKRRNRRHACGGYIVCIDMDSKNSGLFSAGGDWISRNDTQIPTLSRRSNPRQHPRPPRSLHFAARFYQSQAPRSFCVCQLALPHALSSSAFTSSFTVFRIVLPFVAFITWPTKKVIAFFCYRP